MREIKEQNANLLAAIQSKQCFKLIRRVLARFEGIGNAKGKDQ